MVGKISMPVISALIAVTVLRTVHQVVRVMRPIDRFQFKTCHRVVDHRLFAMVVVSLVTSGENVPNGTHHREEVMPLVVPNGL
jgi:hypothetical protein